MVEYSHYNPEKRYSIFEWFKSIVVGLLGILKQVIGIEKKKGG